MAKRHGDCGLVGCFGSTAQRRYRSRVRRTRSLVLAVPANVPGSVQKDLLDAGVIPDWNYGMNCRACQWVENLHWVYETRVPDDWIEQDRSFRLECMGLDGPGWLRVNGEVIAEFDGSHLPHIFDLTSRSARDASGEQA